MVPPFNSVQVQLDSYIPHIDTLCATGEIQDVLYCPF